MRRTLRVLLLLALVAAIGSPAGAVPGSQQIEILKLLGTAPGVVRPFSDFGPIPPTPQGSTQGLCFQLPLVDATRDEVVGTAFDCLSDIAPGPDGNGIILTDTVILDFDGGRIVARDRVTIQPVIDGSPAFTHITGAIPLASTINSLFTSGQFKDEVARVRVSGGVNLSRFGESPPVITFDCLLEVRIQDAR